MAPHSNPDALLWELITTVIERTKQGKIQWEPSGDTSFSTDFPNGTITVSSEDEDGFAPYEVVVQNAKGQQVGVERTTRNQKFDLGSEGVPSSTERNDLLRALFEAARNTGLGISATYESLLDDVRRDQKPNTPIDDIDIPF